MLLRGGGLTGMFACNKGLVAPWVLTRPPKQFLAPLTPGLLRAARAVRLLDYRCLQAIQGVVVDTGSSLTFSNLILSGSTGTTFTPWLPKSSLMLSLFALKGDGSISVVNSTLRVQDVKQEADQLLGLPANGVDPARPALRPSFSVAPSSKKESFFTISSWLLPRSKWNQYLSGSLADITSSTSSSAFWSYDNVRVEAASRAQCFQGALDQGSVQDELVSRVRTDADLRAALSISSTRYVQIVSDITFDPRNWAETLVVSQG